MSYLFVSYSRWDRASNPTIDRLFSDLRAAGVNLWLIPDDAPPGDWSDLVSEKIVGAAGLLYIYSRDMKATPQIRREIKTAQNANLPIYIVALDGGILDQLPGTLRDCPVIPLYLDYHAGLREVIQIVSPDVRGKAQTPAAPKSKGYVFISYAEEDSDFVGTLRAYLRERGYGYWDYQDSDRNYHTQLFLELEEVITNAAATISVISPDWKKSTWAAKEYMFSQEVGTPVFLVMARSTPPTLVIAGVPYIDFTQDAAAGFARLDRELRRKGLIE